MDCTFLHGWGMTNHVWEDFSRKFNCFNKIFAPCLYDTSFRSKDVSFDSTAKTLSDAITKDSVLVAWSVGGLIALKVATFSSKIRAIVFIASSPCFTNQDNWPNVISQDDLEGLKEKLSSNYTGALKYFTGLIAYGDIHPSSTAKYIRQYMAREKNKQILNSWLMEIETIDFRKELASINIPCHFIYGQNDVLVKIKINKQIQKLNSDFCISIINNCGHAAFISQPEDTYNRISKFLNERI